MRQDEKATKRHEEYTSQILEDLMWWKELIQERGK